MKKIIIIIPALFILAISACTNRDVLQKKDGVSLPTVTDLSFVKTDSNHLTVSWVMPTSIPETIQQPLAVFIEVKEVVNAQRIVPVFNTTLANAPLTFEYELPHPELPYHITVKLNGSTKMMDPNFSSNIFSLGETVIYPGE